MQRVLFLSHTADGGSFKVGSHHYARELARFGYEVFHVSTPWSYLNAVLRKDSFRRAQSREGIQLGVDSVRRYVPRTLLPLAASKSQGSIAERLRSAGRWDYCFIDQPTFEPTTRNLDISRLIYRPTDKMQSNSALVAQTRLLQRVDGVVATSQEVLQALNLDERTPHRVIENGVWLEKFEMSVRDDRRSAKAIYVGALDNRFDWSALREMSLAYPSLDFDIYGPLDGREHNLPTNVKLLGSIPYDLVPSTLREGTIGLLPMVDNGLNGGRSPMKMFEYLSSGLRVVALSTPTLDKYASIGGVHLYHPGQSRAALASALSDTSSLEDAVSMSRQQDWQQKAQQLISFASSVPRNRLRHQA